MIKYTLNDKQIAVAKFYSSLLNIVEDCKVISIKVLV